MNANYILNLLNIEFVSIYVFMGERGREGRRENEGGEKNKVI